MSHRGGGGGRRQVLATHVGRNVLHQIRFRSSTPRYSRSLEKAGLGQKSICRRVNSTFAFRPLVTVESQNLWAGFIDQGSVRVFTIANVGMCVPWHDHASPKTRQTKHRRWGTSSTHQNVLASVIYTMFWGSCLASKFLSTRVDPETDITADATNATEMVTRRKRVMVVGSWERK